MDFLKSLWPTPFKIKKGELASFLIQLVIFVVICAVVGVLFNVLGAIPILGTIFVVFGSLVEIYGIVGIVLCVLKFAGVV